MEVTLISNSQKINKPIKKDFYWYNPLNKLMYHGTGSRMEFKYNQGMNMAFPVIIQEDMISHDNGTTDIKKWIKNNTNSFELETVFNGKETTIEFDIEHWDDVIFSLKQSNINFDFDEHQLAKEMANYNAKSRNS